VGSQQGEVLQLGAGLGARKFSPSKPYFLRNIKQSPADLEGLFETTYVTKHGHETSQMEGKELL
jgi:hypothetical protein